ncbi:MAG: hpch/hpai aldolase [Alphaproteobacteria bacterium]|nr:hpch/hpai aldolase [Alphaproteobacteria bacterium]
MASFKDLTQNRELKLGTYIGEFATPGIGQILKSTGCQYAFVDMEHSGFSFETVKAVLRNLHDAGIASLVRPPSKAYHHLARACDVGAQGIIPPMLGTVEEAKACLDAINYVPDGNRGCALNIAHDDYHPASVLDGLAAANRKTCLTPLIETADGIENCDAIAAIDGVDCLWIGHFDLSASLGIPGDFENPLFTDAIDAVVAAGAKHNKSVGRLVGSPEEGAALFKQGFDFICYLGDMWLLQRALNEGFSAIKASVGDGAVAGGS